jgi:hypothetical protein
VGEVWAGFREALVPLLAYTGTTTLLTYKFLTLEATLHHPK